MQIRPYLVVNTLDIDQIAQCLGIPLFYVTLMSQANRTQQIRGQSESDCCAQSGQKLCCGDANQDHADTGCFLRVEGEIARIVLPAETISAMILND